MALSKSTWAKRVRLACIASIASAFAAVAIPATMTTPVEAKTPGKTYCFVGKCHRVKTIEETPRWSASKSRSPPLITTTAARTAYNPCGLTSSGERFHPDRPDNTASPIYPDGTQLLVWSPENKRALVVRVNNAGPYWGNRTLDLSRAAAEKLGFEGEGVAKLKVRVIKAPEVAETKYVENRNYDPVPGDIGQYASLDDAQRGMAVVLAFKATTGSPFAPVTTANAFKGQEHRLRHAGRRGAAGHGPHVDARLLGQRRAAHADRFRWLLDPEPRRPRIRRAVARRAAGRQPDRLG